MRKVYKDIEDFYKEAEMHSGFRIDDTNIEIKLVALKENVTEEDIKRKIDWERAVFQFMIEGGEVKPFYSTTTKDGEVYGYPNYELFDNGGYEYLIGRLNRLENPYLIIKYNHILWCSKKKKQEYVKKAIDTYYQVFIDLLDDTNIETYRKLELFKNGIVLSFQIKYKTELYKNLLKKLLFEVGVLEDRWKVPLIDFLLNQRWFKGRDFDNMIELIQSFNDVLISKNDFFQIHRNLEVAIRIANKTNYSAKPLIKKLGECCEEIANQRSDDETQIIPMIYLSEALSHYESIKETELAEKVSVKIIEVKKNIQLAQINVPIDNMDKIIAPLKIAINNLLKKEPIEIYCFLSNNNPIMFPNLETLKKSAKERPQLISELFKQTNIDINGNIREQNNDEDDKQKKFMQQQYSFHLSIVSGYFLPILFDNGIKRGVITYNSLLEYLTKNTWFGQSLSDNRAGEVVIFNWMEMFAPALLEFFNQMKLFQNTGKFNFILVIDSLSIKFEGILRDFAKVLKIKTITTNKKTKNRSTREMYIEDILAHKKMQEYFDENDRVFFNYLFLSSGMNLRNNIAHSFYRPTDYSISTVLLLIVAILRLSKYKMNID